MSNDDHAALPELPAGEDGTAEPRVNAARLALLFSLLLPAFALGAWLFSLVHPTAGTRSERVAWLLFMVPLVIASGLLLVELEKRRTRVRHAEFFGAVLGGGAPDAEAHPILRAGTLGPNENAVLQFAARLKALSGEQWSDVLYPVRSFRQELVANARQSRAYRRAKRALQAVDASGDATTALGTLLKEEFRHVSETTDQYAPSIAHTAAVAVLVRDAISPADFRSLYAPFEQVIPSRELAAKHDESQRKISR
jgi:hypothetical protein